MHTLLEAKKRERAKRRERRRKALAKMVSRRKAAHEAHKAVSLLGRAFRRLQGSTSFWLTPIASRLPAVPRVRNRSHVLSSSVYGLVRFESGPCLDCGVVVRSMARQNPVNRGDAKIVTPAAKKTTRVDDGLDVGSYSTYSRVS